MSTNQDSVLHHTSTRGPTKALLLLTASFVLGSLQINHAQGLPTEQPKVLTIIREHVKVGRAAEHSKYEAGYPAAMEKAKSPDQVQTGMMFRKQMGDNEGMLFIFAQPLRASFWMRNTLIPLSCAYIDNAGVILETHEMKPLDETPIQAAPDSQVQYVLEMPGGWFTRNNIGPGTVVRTERGSLAETYFGAQP